MKHKPPTDLLLKGGDWGAGLEAITTVHNSDGEVCVCLLTFAEETQCLDEISRELVNYRATKTKENHKRKTLEDFNLEPDYDFNESFSVDSIDLYLIDTIGRTYLDLVENKTVK